MPMESTVIRSLVRSAAKRGSSCLCAAGAAVAGTTGMQARIAHPNAIKTFRKSSSLTSKNVMLYRFIASRAARDNNSDAVNYEQAARCMRLVILSIAVTETAKTIAFP